MTDEELCRKCSDDIKWLGDRGFRCDNDAKGKFLRAKKAVLGYDVTIGTYYSGDDFVPIGGGTGQSVESALNNLFARIRTEMENTRDCALNKENSRKTERPLDGIDGGEG